MKYLFALFAIVLTASSASQIQDISFKPCDPSATYPIVPTSIDVSPYPIQPGKMTTVTVVGISSIDVILSKFVLKYSILQLPFPVTQSCKANQQCTIKASAVVSPLVPGGATITADANIYDSDNNNDGCYKVDIKTKSTALDMQLRDGPEFYKCDDSETCLVELATLTEDPYPIKKGSSDDVTACGTASQDVTIEKAVAYYGSTKLEEIQIGQSFKKGVQDCIKITISCPYIPFISSATISLKLLNPSGTQVACYKVKTALQYTEEDYKHDLMMLQEKAVFSKCDASKTYSVDVKDVTLDPDPVELGKDLTVTMAGDVLKSEDVTYCSVSVAGTTQKIDINQHYDAGQSINVTKTQSTPWIPFIKHATATVKCYNTGGEEIGCYNVSISIKATEHQELK